MLTIERFHPSIGRGRFTRTAEVHGVRRPSTAFLFLVFALVLMALALPSRTAAADESGVAGQDSGWPCLESVGTTVVDWGEAIESEDSPVPAGVRETSEAFRYTDEGLLATPWALESGAFSG